MSSSSNKPTGGSAPSISNIPILSVPYKSTSQASWESPLSKHIQSAYGDNPEDYTREIASLHKLRQDMRGAESTADLTARDILLKYFGQLELLELHFPMDDGSVEVPFEWFDAFTGDSTAQSSLAFEKACTIFNIAATFSRLAAATPRDVKGAYHYLQVSSGLFKFINDNFLHAPSHDLSGDAIKFLSDLMHAQAQEIILEKTLADKAGKVTKMTTKITAGLAHLYSQLSAQCFQGTNLGMYLDSCTRVFSQTIAVKAKLFAAHAAMHRAILAESEALYGEVVGRLSAALSDLKDADRWAKSISNSAIKQAASSGILTSDGVPQLVELVKMSLSLANDSHARANKDNDVIYHEQIPARDSLPVLDQIILPDFLGFDHVLPGGAHELQVLVGNDIFASLIPMHVHEKSSVYSEQKASVLRSATEMASILDAEMASSLSSLGFPGALEKLIRFVQTQDSKNDSAVDELSPELQVMVSEIFGHQVQEFYSTVSAITREVQTQLDEALLLLDSDKALEDRIKSVSPSAWTLPPSLDLNQRRDLANLRETARANAARNAAQYAEYETGILNNPVLAPIRPKHLAPKTSLLSPYSSEQSLLDVDIGHSTIDLINQIRALRDKVAQLNTLKRERGSIVSELKAKMQADDISELLVLNAKQNVDDHIFRTELSKYTPLTDKLKANAAYTRNAVKDIQNAWDEVQSHPQARDAANAEARRHHLKTEIETANLVVKRVTTNLTESIQTAIEFQDNAQSVIRSIQSVVAHRQSETQKIEKSSAPTPSQTDFLRQQLSRMDVGPANSHPHHRSPLPNPPASSLPYSSMGSAMNPAYNQHGPAAPIPTDPYPTVAHAAYPGSGAYPTVNHTPGPAFAPPGSYQGFQGAPLPNEPSLGSWSYPSQTPGYIGHPPPAQSAYSAVPSQPNYNYPSLSNTYPSLQQHGQPGYSASQAGNPPPYVGYSNQIPHGHYNQPSSGPNQQPYSHQYTPGAFPSEPGNRSSGNLLD